MSNYVANYVFCDETLYDNFLNADFDNRMFQEGMYDPIGCILDERRRLVIFDSRGMEYKRDEIEKIISQYHDVVWNCVEENRIEEGQFYWDGEKVALKMRPLQVSDGNFFFTIEYYDPDYKTFKLIIGFPDRIIEENYVTNTRREFNLVDCPGKQIMTYMDNIRKQILKESDFGEFPARICGDILDEYCFWSPDDYMEHAYICRCDAEQISQEEFNKGEGIIKEVKGYLAEFFRDFGIDIKLTYKEISEFIL